MAERERKTFQLLMEIELELQRGKMDKLQVEVWKKMLDLEIKVIELLKNSNNNG